MLWALMPTTEARGPHLNNGPHETTHWKYMVHGMYHIPRINWMWTRKEASTKQSTGFAMDLSAEDFSRYTTDSTCILLDVRTHEEFQSGHIPGALMIDYYEEDFADRISTLDKAKTIYIYCRSGGRSGRAMKMMQEQVLIIFTISMAASKPGRKRVVRSATQIINEQIQRACRKPSIGSGRLQRRVVPTLQNAAAHFKGGRPTNG